MRIVHFSDLHVGCWSRDPSALLDKRLLGTLNYFLRRRPSFLRGLLPRALLWIQRLAPDWIICTGDLTCVGAPEEFAAGVAALKPLVDRAAGRFLFVPGNHDAYVRNRRCRAALEAAVATLNAGRFSLGDLPLEVRLGALRLFLVDESCPSGLIMSSGQLPAAAQARLAAWLAAPRESGEKRLLVGHFPLRDRRGRPLPWRRGVHGAELLRAALAQGQVDYALCGHEHCPYLRRETSGAVEVCAGALMLYGRLNVLDYSPATGAIIQSWVDVAGDEEAPALLGPELAAAGLPK